MNLSGLCAQRAEHDGASSCQYNMADTPRAQTMRHVNKTVASTGQRESFSLGRCRCWQRVSMRSQQNLHNHNQNGINNKSNANTTTEKRQQTRRKM